MVSFVDANRDDLGVEPICRTLQVAPSTYYAAKSRRLSALAIRDAVMMPILLALWQANYRVYGVRKLWKAVAPTPSNPFGRSSSGRLSALTTMFRWKHLPAYLDELEWRHNNRKNPYLFRDTLIRLCESEVLGYQDLIAS